MALRLALLGCLVHLVLQGRGGWTEVTPLGTLPPARQDHSGVIAATGRMWIFGGSGSDIFNDLWYIDTSEGQNGRWTEVTPLGTLPPARNEHSAVITGTGRMWIFGGHIGYGAKSNDLWYIDTSEGQNGRWTEVTPLGTLPRTRRSHSAVITGTGRMWIFGGEGMYSSRNLNDLWYIETSEGHSGRWTKVTPLGTLPPARTEHSAVITATGQMWIFGGSDNNYRELNDLWYINTSEGQGGNWTEVTPLGTLPPARQAHRAVITGTGLMWIFGGDAGWGHGNSNDLWYIDTSEVQDRRWTEVTACGVLPPARYDHRAIITATSQIWISGGFEHSTLNDLWYFDASKVEEKRIKAEEARRRAEEERHKAEEERRKAEEAAEEERRKAEEAAEEERRKAEEKAAEERRKLELVGQLLPVLMASHSCVAVIIFGYWLRWQPAEMTEGAGTKTMIGKRLMDTE